MSLPAGLDLVATNLSSISLNDWALTAILPGAIIAFGVTFLVPFTKNAYGKRDFDWPHSEPESFVFRALVFAVLSTLLAWCDWPEGHYAKSAGATLLIALYGVLRLDGKFHVIPDRFQILGASAATYLFALEHGVSLASFYAYGLALLPGLIFWAFSALYARFRKRDGIGFGDIKMLCWLSVLFGEDVFLLLFTASVLLLLRLTPSLLLRRAKLDTAFAFGPYLVVATVALLATN